MTTDYRISKTAKALFKTYNRALEIGYDEYLKELGISDTSREIKENPERLTELLNAAEKRWEGVPIPELEGKSPLEYFKEIGSFEEVMELFIGGALLCDDTLPSMLAEKLKSFGETAVKALLVYVTDQHWKDGNNDSLLISSAAIRMLGEWKAEDAVEDLTAVLSSTEEYSEFIMEKIKDALVNIGPPCTASIIRSLETAEQIRDPQEYLLMALSDIGTDYPCEQIYQTLKSVFRRMDNKVTGALCLGNYGDGRAIPVLRGCLEKNRSRLSKEEFFDIKSAIHMLGGSAEDIVYQPPISKSGHRFF